MTRKDVMIEGDRIYLRKVRLSDANNSYLRWLNDEEVSRFLESRFKKWTMAGLRKYIKAITGNPDNLFLAIILKEGNRHIGNIKLGPINRAHNSAEIGIIIGEKDCWGKGFATEAIRLVSGYAFGRSGIHKLTAGAYSNNGGSIKAFQKAGFSTEGVRRKQCLSGGKYVDCALLGRIRK
ncbi:MAG: GNAT family protein [Candidatus Omnitrophica bacterium]|nr:GNAT family protein [Candidatus Omnitrophota bacterium]